MLDTYTFVEGASLANLILEVRERFFAEQPSAEEPHVVRHVALESFEASSSDRRAAVVADLLLSNVAIYLEREAAAVFDTATSPADVFSDLVAEIVWQILMRDPMVADEERHRESHQY